MEVRRCGPLPVKPQTLNILHTRAIKRVVSPPRGIILANCSRGRSRAVWLACTTNSRSSSRCGREDSHIRWRMPSVLQTSSIRTGTTPGVRLREATDKGAGGRRSHTHTPLASEPCLTIREEEGGDRRRRPRRPRTLGALTMPWERKRKDQGDTGRQRGRRGSPAPSLTLPRAPAWRSWP